MAPFFVSALPLCGHRLAQVGFAAENEEGHVTEQHGIWLAWIIVIGAFDYQVQILFLPPRLHSSTDFEKYVIRPGWIFDSDAIGPVAARSCLGDFAFGVIQPQDQLRQLL